MTKLNESVKRLYRKKKSYGLHINMAPFSKKEIPSTNNLSMLVTSLSAIHRQKEKKIMEKRAIPVCQAVVNGMNFQKYLLPCRNGYENPEKTIYIRLSINISLLINIPP